MNQIQRSLQNYTEDDFKKMYDMLLERLSKISGALRYKDKGISMQITGIFNAAGRFEVDLGSDLNLFPEASYEISLQSFATTSNITNVTTANNKFYFTPSVAIGMQSVTLPTGVYGLDSLNVTIQTLMQNAGFYNTAAGAISVPTGLMAGGVNIGALYNVNITANPATQKAVLQIRYTSGYIVHFNQPNSLYKMLGFLATDTFTDTAAATPNNGSYYSAVFSTNPVDLTNGTLSINIGCSLAEGAALITNNKVIYSQIIASKPYVDPPGTILSIIPATPLKLNLIKDLHKIRHFSVFAVDNILAPLNFNSSTFVMNLVVSQA